MRRKLPSSWGRGRFCENRSRSIACPSGHLAENLDETGAKLHGRACCPRNPAYTMRGRIMAPGRSVDGAAGSPRPLVLVVEDDRETRRYYTTVLSTNGFRTEEAHNGFQALEKATTLAPDLILTDI